MWAKCLHRETVFQTKVVLKSQLFEKIYAMVFVANIFRCFDALISLKIQLPRLQIYSSANFCICHLFDINVAQKSMKT